jgi:CDP-diacylglycerol---glycerol-3-phosphate 3-phosphatidyltransferase
MNLANKLTFLRIALVPVFMLFVFIDHPVTRLLALLIFGGASLTDLYDGWLARRHNYITDLGKFMDPLADKLLVSAAFISFVELQELSIPAWMVIVIISREFIITGLRTLAAAKGKVLAASRAGKYKTTSQMTSIIIILTILALNAMYKSGYINLRFENFDWYFTTRLICYWLMALTTVLTAISGMSLIHKYKNLFLEESQ